MQKRIISSPAHCLYHQLCLFMVLWNCIWLLFLIYFVEFVFCPSAGWGRSIFGMISCCLSSEEAALWPFFTDHQGRNLCRLFSLMIPSAWKAFFPRWSHNYYLLFTWAWDQMAPSPRGPALTPGPRETPPSVYPDILFYFLFQRVRFLSKNPRIGLLW